jgi:parallel beta helix pectate lyase-like protein
MLLASAPVFAAVTNGRSFYVDPSGNDANAGTSPQAPWRTIARVNRTDPAPGDTVYFKSGGLWRETLDPPRGGTPGKPITFTSYGAGPPPVISGSEIVDDWNGSGPVSWASFSREPYNVYAGKAPGWGLRRACCREDASCSPSGRCAIGPLTESSWYWDRATKRLYVWLDRGRNPTSQLIEAAVRLYGVEVVANGGEKSNINIERLAFERAGGYGMFFYSSDQGGDGTTGVVVRDCIVSQTGTGHIDDGSYYNGIHYSQARKLATAPLFEGNLIEYTGNHGNGINSQNADGARIVKNDVSHFNHSGIDVKYCDGVLVRGNRVHDSIDTNGIYEEFSTNSRIEHNIVYRLTGATLPGRGSGIQLDSECGGGRIARNSIFDVLTGIYLKLPAVIEYNAISNVAHALVDAKDGGVVAKNVLGPGGAVYIRNQIVRQAALESFGNLIADPEFVNPATGDFAPRPSSPCIKLNAGAMK